MSSLGDFIPSENIKNIISMQIQPGAVFLLYDKNAGKHKFIVILGVDAARVCVGTLYINSEVNTNVIRTLEQRHLQFRIKAGDYDFLDHDSWINASSIIRRNYDYLLRIFISREGQYKGQINPRDF